MTNHIEALRKTIATFSPSQEPREIPEQRIGHVEAFESGMAVVSIRGAAMGNFVRFEGGSYGIVSSIYRDDNDEHMARVVLLEDKKNIHSKETVSSENSILTVPSGRQLAGRVINGIGFPEDGGPSLEHLPRVPIEREAASFLVRQNVDTPMDTGTLVVDALFPIGRGQRELLIGDRQTGKTALAMDVINNQKRKDVFCIYVAIGKKRQDTNRIIESLRRTGALEYTVVVMAPSDLTPAMQYYAPFTGCAIGESIMCSGGDALIIYDDLVAHSWAHRQAALMQGRPPGREAYPGDMFSIDARLLERASRLADTLQIIRKDTGEPINDTVYTDCSNMLQAKQDLAALPDAENYEIRVVKKGGSLTALPILETQQGEFSALIPTNVVSITDGQLYFDPIAYNARMRPAVHVGLSVSRVGSDAQPPGVKALFSGLQTSLANLAHLETIARVGEKSLDINTRKQLNHARHLQQLIVQDEKQPWTVGEKIVLLYAGTHRTVNFDTVPLEKMKNFIDGYVQYLYQNHNTLMTILDEGNKLSEDQEHELSEALSSYLSISL